MSPIRQLSKTDKAAFSNIMAAAFEHDPLFQTAFLDKQSKHKQVFLEFMFNKSFVSNEKLLGYYSNDQLKAMAILQTLPKVSLWQNLRLFGLIILLIKQLPFGTLRLLNDYMRLVSRQTREHYYLTMLGVHPNAQGQGIGKALLLECIKYSDASAQSEGIGLDTENPDNIVLYEHFGFKLEETKSLQNLKIYCMFKAKQTVTKNG